MTKMLTCLAAAVVIAGGLTALPAAAAGTAAPATKAAPAHHKSAHKASCYDYAWDSQQMKDCLAKGDKMTKPAAAHLQLRAR